MVFNKYLSSNLDKILLQNLVFPQNGFRIDTNTMILYN